MTDVEKRVRTLGPWRFGIVALAVAALVIPVMAVMAASPDPSTSTPASSAGASPKATHAVGTQRDGDSKGDKRQGGDRKGFGGGLGRGLAGGFGAVTVTAVDGSKVSLTTADGWTRTITVTADTTITKGGQAVKVGDLDVGDTVLFRQKRNDDGTFSILAIVVPTPKAAGEVTAVTTSSLTLKGRGDQTRTITLNGSTTYQLGKAKADRADIQVGSRVVVEGTVSGDTFTALSVHIALSSASGEVTAKTADSITLKRRDGKTTVIHVSADTTFRVRGKDAATIADIAVGDRVGAAGTTRADGSLDAVSVAGRAPRTNDPKKAPAASTTPG